MQRDGLAGNGMIRAMATALMLALAPVAALAATAMEQARAAMVAGDTDAAAEAGRRAYRAAATEAERLAAARLVAAAHFRAGRFLRAEAWLRRALEHAHDAGERDAVAADFAGLRAASPLRLLLTLSAAPNSNINNGSSSKTVTIWGLPFVLNADARPLSGIQYDAGVDMALTVSEAADHLTEIGFAASVQMFSLSAEAQRNAPDVEASDYSFAAAEVYMARGWRHDLLDGAARARLSFGQSWYAGLPYQRTLRLDLAQDMALGPATVMSLSYGTAAQWSAETGAFANAQNLSLGLAHALGDGLRATAAVGREVTRSADIFARNSANSADLSLKVSRADGWPELTLRAGLEDRVWPVTFYGPDGRQDISAMLGADIALRRMSRFGFLPVLSVEGRRTRSNISLFDRRSVALSFGLESEF